MSRAQDYRLRSFEMAYVQPHLDFFDARGLRVVESLPVDPTGETDLRFLLLKEATNWIDMGRWCGYFSRELDPLPLLFGGYDVREIVNLYDGHNSARFELVLSDWTSMPHPWPFADGFSEGLSTAMEDLTDDRLEFLRLYLFSMEAEWEERIAELEVVLRELEAGQRQIPGRILDLVSWAFNGTESGLKEGLVYLPADWRVDPLYELRTDAVRANALRRPRGKIERFVRTMLAEQDIRAEDPSPVRYPAWMNEYVARGSADEPSDRAPGEGIEDTFEDRD